MRWARSLLLLGLAVAGCGDDGGDAPDASTPGDAGVDAGEDSGAPDAGPPPPRVETASGPVAGRRGDGYLEFLGIPYAEAPVGDLRWRPPRPHPGWTEVVEATSTPSRCPQAALGLALGGDEDCLFLNVHTPDPAPDGAPVMVWIHGGAYTFGEGVQTDGGTRGDIIAARTGLVVVSMNYRLAALGFLAHPALAADEARGVSGNFGLLDQVEALRWVRDNITAFGGDPANVTLFGESAGGGSVCAHLVNPDTDGLFHAAIVESGPCGRRMATLEDAEAQGARFSERIGCAGAADEAACLRGKSLDDVLATLPPPGQFVDGGEDNGSWRPVVDGDVFPDQQIDLLRRGDFHRVPLMIGWNRDEGTLFLDISGAEVTDEEYPARLAEYVGGPGEDADRVLAQYPLEAYESAWYALADVFGDVGLACPGREAIVAVAPHTTTYGYYFTYPDADFQLPTERDLGAFHLAEVQYVFGHPGRIGRRAFTTDDDRALHDALLGYWTRFAATHDPNGDGAAAWPEFTPDEQTSIVLDREIGTQAEVKREVCELWASLGL